MYTNMHGLVHGARLLPCRVTPEPHICVLRLRVTIDGLRAPSCQTTSVTFASVWRSACYFQHDPSWAPGCSRQWWHIADPTWPAPLAAGAKRRMLLHHQPQPTQTSVCHPHKVSTMDLYSQTHGIESTCACNVLLCAQSPPRCPRVLYIVKPSPDLIPSRVHGLVTSLVLHPALPLTSIRPVASCMGLLFMVVVPLWQ